MRAGINGRVAISWDQTEIDGLEAAPMSFLSVGAAWSWRGQVRFLVDPAEQFLDRAGVAQGAGASALAHFSQLAELGAEASGTIVLTNGAQQFTAVLVPVAGEASPTLVFEDGCPARDQEFWVSEFTDAQQRGDEPVELDDTVVAFPVASRKEAGVDVSTMRSTASAATLG